MENPTRQATFFSSLDVTDEDFFQLEIQKAMGIAQKRASPIIYEFKMVARYTRNNWERKEI